MSALSAEPPRVLERFSSEGKEIRVETFGASGDPKVPSLIVLHGATGVEFANRFIANLAQEFAGHGFVVHLVHYFDRTGAKYADDATIKRSSSAWLKTVHHAVRFVRERRPGAAVGVFGYSLGGYLAAAETVLHDEIDAAVILSGGLDEASAQAARRSPPMLILHGSADTRVPLAEARRLESVLKRLGEAPEFHVYSNEGHILQWRSYADVISRGTAFLQKHLRKERVPR